MIGSTILVAVALFATPVEASASGPVLEVELEAKATDTLPARGLLILEATTHPYAVVRLPLSEMQRTEVPPLTAWWATLEADGYWAARTLLRAPDAGTRRFSLRVWPAGTLAGRARIEEGYGLPDSLALTLTPPPWSGEIGPEGQVDCPIDPELGTWSCTVPAGTVDFTAKLPGFTPQYRWGVEIARGRTSRLELDRFETGASVAGWVEAEEGELDRRRARVRLLRPVAPGTTNRRTIDRLRSTAVTTSLDARGFFQFTDVAAGTYQLEAEQPGFATVRIDAFEVWPESESRVAEPIVLRRPLELVLELVPARSWLDEPWAVTVLRAGDFAGAYSDEPVYDGPAGEDGRVRVPGQSPGRYWIVIADSLGTTFVSDPDIEIRSAEDAVRTFELEVVTVEGHARLGDEPLVAANLWFGGAHGAVRSEMQTDDEGGFYGVLPREGRWEVEVRSESVDSHLAVTVEADASHHAEVEVVLPATEITGRVVAEASGEPVAGARVLFVSEVRPLTVSSDAAGEFAIRGVPEGLGRLSAEAAVSGRKANSPEVLLSVAEGQELGPIELALAEQRLVRGRVLSPEGKPVPGAVVTGGARNPAVGSTWSRARTALDGLFELEVPQRAASVLAVISAPGFALRVFSIDDRAGEPLLHLARGGGDLELTVPVSPEEYETEGLEILLWQNGVPLGFKHLYQWTASRGGTPRVEEGRFRFTRLAGGDYLICLVRHDPRRSFEADRQSPSQCAGGYLSEGGVLALELERPR